MQSATVKIRLLAGMALQARKLMLQTNVTMGQNHERFFSKAIPSPDTIIINEKAVQQMKKVCEDGSRLRVVVEGGGCSGFQYLFSLSDRDIEPEGEDILISYKGFEVIIDEDSLEYVRGSTLDYNTELIRSAFRLVDNPLAELGCSCGASFAIKDL